MILLVMALAISVGLLTGNWLLVWVVAGWLLSQAVHRND